MVIPASDPAAAVQSESQVSQPLDQRVLYSGSNGRPGLAVLSGGR